MSYSNSIDEKLYERVLQADLLSVFESHHNDNVDPYYLDRADRNRFAAEQLSVSSPRKILNLGGGGARHLQAKLSNPDIEVFEVDVQGDCDLKANLDGIERLPFEDGAFEVVCAFDLLEHLENFHLMNEEMYRVAGNYMLVSLPNSAAEIFFDFFRNRPQKQKDLNRGVFSIFYGIPLVAPVDRHRWWMYFHDIIRFYYYFSQKHGADLEFWTPKLNFRKKLFRLLFGSHLYHSFFCPHVWIKVSKKKN